MTPYSALTESTQWEEANPGKYKIMKYTWNYFRTKNIITVHNILLSSIINTGKIVYIINLVTSIFIKILWMGFLL